LKAGKLSSYCGGCAEVGGGVVGGVLPGLLGFVPVGGLVLPVGGCVLPVGGFTGGVLFPGVALPGLFEFGVVLGFEPGFEVSGLEPGLAVLGFVEPGVVEPGFVVLPGEPDPAPGLCGVVCGVVPPVEGVVEPGVELCPVALPPDPALPADPAEPAEPALWATAQAEQPANNISIANFLRLFISFVLYRERQPRRMLI
jgi:hypothetical protein